MTGTVTVDRRKGRGSRLRQLWAPAVLVIVALFGGGAVVASHSMALSPIDEWMYIDYLNKLPDQVFVRQGEAVGADALERLACNGLQAYGAAGPACSGDLSDLAAFPYGGIQYANLYTPVFFGLTWFIAGPIQFVTGMDILVAARYAGVLWLAVTVLVLYLMFRQFGLSKLVAFGVGLAFMATPYAWWTFTFLSTDTPSVAIGAVALIGALAVAKRGASAWWLVLLSAVAISMKAGNIVAIGLFSLYLIAHFLVVHAAARPWAVKANWGLAIRGHGPLAFVPAVAGSLIVVALVQGVWLAVIAATAVGPPPDLGIGKPLEALDVLAQVVNFIPGTATTGADLLPHVSASFEFVPQFARVMSWIFVAGVLGAAWLTVRGDPNWLETAIVLIAGLVAGPALAVILTQSIGEYYVLPARYGASLMPAFLLSLGVLIMNRRASQVFLAIAATALIAMLWMTLAS